MPRKLIKHWLPDPRKIAESSALKPFGTLAQTTSLWHLNRRSASGAFAIGLFWAFMPMPFQMVAAAATAILLRVNLPLSVALVWISNPITMPPMLYGAYRIGSWLMNLETEPFLFELSFAWFRASIASVVPPLLLGSVVLGSTASLLGYFTIRTLWRQAVRNAWRERIRERRAQFIKTIQPDKDSAKD